MRAYLIDPFRNLITTVDLTEDHREIARALGCDHFDLGRTFCNGDALYVDDEGLLKDEVTRGFTLDGRFFAGRGLLLGTTPDGRSTDVRTPELDVAALVQFPPDGWVLTEDVRDQLRTVWVWTFPKA